MDLKYKIKRKPAGILYFPGLFKFNTIDKIIIISSGWSLQKNIELKLKA